MEPTPHGERRGTIFRERNGGHVVEESVSSLLQADEVAARVAILRKLAERERVALPKDVAFYIARNGPSGTADLKAALTRLVAHSSLTGTQITLAYTQALLKKLIRPQSREVAFETLRKSLAARRGTRETPTRRLDLTATESPSVLCLLKIQGGIGNNRVKNELQVNMREHEREQLARRDVYERELELRAGKRKKG
jgi:Bacterial dnaA  protein